MTASAGTATVPSPCNQVCRIDARTGWCAGCGRTLDEIAAWGTMADERKRAVWLALPARQAALRDTGRGDR